MAASPRPTASSVPLLVIPQGYPRRIAGIDPNFSASREMRGVCEDIRARDHAGARSPTSCGAPSATCATAAAVRHRRNPDRYLGRGDRRHTGTAHRMQHGPGSENAYGGVAQAYSESVPLLVIPQGYPRRIADIDPNFSAVARDARRGEDLRARDRAGEIANVLRRAFSNLRNGRSGPAHRRNPDRHLERGDRRSRLHAGQPRALRPRSGAMCARRPRRSWQPSGR